MNQFGSIANMGRSDYLKLGSWNARCSMCGFKFKAEELTKNWQGMMRCRRCQETRHPQEYVRAVVDNQTPPWTQSLDTPTYVEVSQVITTDASIDTSDTWLTTDEDVPLTT